MVIILYLHKVYTNKKSATKFFSALTLRELLVHKLEKKILFGENGAYLLIFTIIISTLLTP
jgi:hypothetical protein